MMNRRGFLAGILAAGIAPYIVTSSGVMMPLGKILTLQALAMEGWKENAYGEVWLELGDKLTLDGSARLRHDYFVAEAETSFTGRLQGQPGCIVNGIFVPARVKQVRHDQYALAAKVSMLPAAGISTAGMFRSSDWVAGEPGYPYAQDVSRTYGKPYG